MPTAAAFTLVAGVAFALQISVNGLLGRRIGVVQTAAFSALITTALMHLIALATRGGLGGVYSALRLPPWLWVGGLLGAVGLSAITYAPPRIGAFATVSLLLAGQLAGGVVIDAFGWFGVTRAGITPFRATGLALVVGGALLVLKR